MPVLGQPNLLQETLHQKDQQFWQLYLGMEHVSWNEYNFDFLYYKSSSLILYVNYKLYITTNVPLSIIGINVHL